MKNFASKRLLMIAVTSLTTAILGANFAAAQADPQTICSSLDPESQSAQSGRKVGYETNCLGQTKSLVTGRKMYLEDLIKKEVKDKLDVNKKEIFNQIKDFMS